MLLPYALRSYLYSGSRTFSYPELHLNFFSTCTSLL
uniref:Uncharacterized protein n=1 Tax=Arundo donax TaxID=35708 RepID=A0A0A8Z0R0_ARUDO